MVAASSGALLARLTKRFALFNKIKCGKRMYRNDPSVSPVQLRLRICGMLGVDAFDEQAIKDRLESLQVSAGGVHVVKWYNMSFNIPAFPYTHLM